MTDLLTAAQMREIEQTAIESGAVTGLELMERAGQGAVAAALDAWPELNRGGRRALVLCGPGNNGGDGFVVARHLRARGWEVATCLWGDPETLPPDARRAHDRWCRVGAVASIAQAPRGPFDLIVDALFGTGLSRPIADPAVQAQLAAFDGMADRAGGDGGTRTLALDVPSGLDADSGRVLGTATGSGVCAPRAMLTATFHSRKIGHCLAQGPGLCGRVVVVDIGLGAAATGIDPAGAAGAARVALVGPEAGRRAAVRDEGHKYSHGHAMVLSGGVGRGGAARMAARGALRIGAGLVTLGCPPAAVIENAARLDAVMLRRIEDDAALAALLEGDARLNAVALGPGLGIGERSRALVLALLVSRRAAVLDADALTSFAEDPGALFAQLHGKCVLTPHGGEFARLFPDLAGRLDGPADRGPAFSRVDAVRAAAARAGCVVLLKGADTVIAAPDGSAAVNCAAGTRAAPWLATAGAGDVLTGFIAGLLARGLAPLRAAASAAWLHVDCALTFGPGLIAEDLPEQLPVVFRNLLAPGRW